MGSSCLLIGKSVVLVHLNEEGHVGLEPENASPESYPRLPARKSALKHTRETRTQHDPLRLARFASLLWVIALGHCFGSLLWVIALGHCFGSLLSIA
jgi:hypothetical protein